MTYTRTPEHRQKMREIKMGQTHSRETKLKISLHHHDVSGENNPMFGRHRTESEKLNLRNLRLGKKNLHYCKPMLGKKRSEEFKQRMQVLMSGSNGPNWQGGKTSEHEIIRSSGKYKKWRSMVFERDNYTCTVCNVRGGKLNADHVKPFAKYPEFRFDINNGRTLCLDCHKKTDTYGWNIKWKEHYEKS